MPVLGLLQHFNSRPCLVLIRIDMVVVGWNVIVFSNNSSVYWNASFIHPRSSHKCNRITESVMSSPSRSLCCFRQFDHNIWSLASHPGSSESMALFSAGSHHICHLAASVSNVTIICLPGTHPPAVSPRFCFRSFTLHCIHHSSEYSHFFLFPKSTPLCRWHSAVLILPPTWLRLQYWSPSECSNSNSDSIVLWHFFRWFHRLTTLIIHHPLLFHSRLKNFLYCKSFQP